MDNVSALLHKSIIVTADMPSSNKVHDFIIVDPSLDGFIGHHHDYDVRTASAAQNLGSNPVILSKFFTDPQILCDERIRPSFRFDMWCISPGNAPWSEADILKSNRQFYLDLVRAIGQLTIGEETVIFGHMITAKQIMGWAWFAQHQMASRNISLVLLLRYEPELYTSELSLLAFRQLERLASGQKIRLASDSAQLARAYAKFTTLPIETLPIPVEVPVQHNISDADAAPIITSTKPIRFGCFGNPRVDKGFLDFLDAIHLVNTDGAGQRCEFILQANDPGHGIEPALSAFARNAPDNVQFLTTVMTSEAYSNALMGVDVVVIPYWVSVYALRTSGVFVEAVCAGKIVICSEDTWMSAELAKVGAGCLCFEKSPDSILAAMKTVIASFDHLCGKAAEAASHYRSFHNAREMAVRLLQKALVQGKT